MALKKKCPYCESLTVAKRILGFYMGSDNKQKLWECRKCKGIWSNETTK
jgi:transposase-like protein